MPGRFSLQTFVFFFCFLFLCLLFFMRSIIKIAWMVVFLIRILILYTNNHRHMPTFFFSFFLSLLLSVWRLSGDEGGVVPVVLHGGLVLLPVDGDAAAPFFPP